MMALKIVTCVTLLHDGSKDHDMRYFSCMMALFSFIVPCLPLVVVLSRSFLSFLHPPLFHSFLLPPSLSVARVSSSSLLLRTHFFREALGAGLPGIWEDSDLEVLFCVQDVTWPVFLLSKGGLFLLESSRWGVRLMSRLRQRVRWTPWGKGAAHWERHRV